MRLASVVMAKASDQIVEKGQRIAAWLLEAADATWGLYCTWGAGAGERLDDDNTLAVTGYRERRLCRLMSSSYWEH